MKHQYASQATRCRYRAENQPAYGGGMVDQNWQFVVSKTFAEEGWKTAATAYEALFCLAEKNEKLENMIRDLRTDLRVTLAKID